jgi:hypothetical protein
LQLLQGILLIKNFWFFIVLLNFRPRIFGALFSTSGTFKLNASKMAKNKEATLSTIKGLM